MNAVEIPAVGAVPFHVAFHHARPQDSPDFLNLGKVGHIHLFQVCVNWTRLSLLAVGSWKGDRVLVNILLIPALLH